MQESILATIPQGETDTVLEVVLIYDQEGERKYLELRSLVWSESLGWYRQQTLKLDSLTTRALLRTLRHVHVDRNGPARQHGKVIPLPLPRRRSTRATSSVSR